MRHYKDSLVQVEAKLLLAQTEGRLLSVQSLYIFGKMLRHALTKYINDIKHISSTNKTFQTK